METNGLPKELAAALDALALDAAACMAFLGIAIADHTGIDRRTLMAHWRESLPAKTDPAVEPRHRLCRFRNLASRSDGAARNGNGRRNGKREICD